jgi:hypothetical protein
MGKLTIKQATDLLEKGILTNSQFEEMRNNGEISP